MKKYLVVYSGKFMGGSTEVEGEREALSAAKELWESGLYGSVVVEDEYDNVLWEKCSHAVERSSTDRKIVRDAL